MDKPSRPEFNPDKCIKCGLCVDVCAPQAILIDEMRATSRCIGCYHCMSVCPTGAITVDGKLGEDVGDAISPDDFVSLVKRRRSLRNFDDKDIPEDVIDNIAEMLRYSPTSHNTQRVHITAVIGRDRVSRLSSDLRDFLYRRFSLLSNPVVNLPLRLFMGKDVATSVKKSRKYFARMKDEGDIFTYNAPALLIFHGSGEMVEWDSHVASAYTTLYIETLGLGGCLNGYMVMALNWSKKLRTSLGIPEGHRVHAAMTLGYPAVRFRRQVFRLPPKINKVKS